MNYLRERVDLKDRKHLLTFLGVLITLTAIPLTIFATANVRGLLSRASEESLASSVSSSSRATALVVPDIEVTITNCSVDASLDSEELEFLRLINEHRRSSGLGPLAI